jgi:hypothetical protein
MINTVSNNIGQFALYYKKSSFPLTVLDKVSFVSFWEDEKKIKQYNLSDSLKFLSGELIYNTKPVKGRSDISVVISYNKVNVTYDKSNNIFSLNTTLLNCEHVIYNSVLATTNVENSNDVIYTIFKKETNEDFIATNKRIEKENINSVYFSDVEVVTLISVVEIHEKILKEISDIVGCGSECVDKDPCDVCMELIRYISLVNALELKENNKANTLIDYFNKKYKLDVQKC